MVVSVATSSGITVVSGALSSGNIVVSVAPCSGLWLLVLHLALVFQLLVLLLEELIYSIPFFLQISCCV